MEKLEKNWADFKDENAGLWPTLVRNQQRIAQASLLTQQMIDEVLISTRHREILGLTWAALHNEATEFRRKLQSEQDEFKTKLDKNAKSIKELQAEIKQLEQARKAGEKLAALALRQRQAWEAKLHLYERGAQDLLVREARKRRGLTVRDTSEIFQAISEEEVTVYDSEGNIETKTVGELLKNDPDVQLARQLAGGLRSHKDYLKLLQEIKGFQGLQPPPGIDHEILSLAVDLSRVKLARVRLTEDFLRQQQSLNPQHTAAIGWFGRALVEIDGMGSTQKGKTVFESLEDSLATPVATDSDTQSLLQALQYIALAEDYYYRTRRLLEINLATLTHEYEIRASAISAQEHEALLDRGLQALATYHAGGITEEEVATIYRAVQVAALFRIADKNDVTIKGER